MLVRIINVATVLVFAVVIGLTAWSLWTDDGPEALHHLAREPMSAVEFQKALHAGHRLGPAVAPVRILLYTVYECSFCREFESVLKQARERYPDHLTVAVRLFTSWEINRNQLYIAAECAAEQGVFEEFHLEAMGVRSATTTRRLAAWTSVLDAIAVPDDVAFRRCVEEVEHADRLEMAYEEGRRLSVVGVPTFFVNGVRYVGALDFPALDSVVAAALRKRAYHAKTTTLPETRLERWTNEDPVMDPVRGGW